MFDKKKKEMKNVPPYQTANRATTSQRRSWPLSRLHSGRLVFILCLVAVSAGLGIAAFFVQSTGEAQLARHQFSGAAERALHAAKDITLRKRNGTVTLASIYANAFPFAGGGGDDGNDGSGEWPFVALPGMKVIANNIITATNGRGLAFIPIVKPEEVDAFERFAYGYYASDDRPPYEDPSETVGISSFGRGVYSIDMTLKNASDYHYHDATGYTKWGSPYRVLTPMLQIQNPALGESAKDWILYNYHSFEGRGREIDAIIRCSEENRVTGGSQGEEEVDVAAVGEDATLDDSHGCGSLSDPEFFPTTPESLGPGAVMIEPIFPFYNRTILKGFIASSIVWSDVLENVFSEEAYGIDCILSTQTQQFTYRITRGVASYVGEGDLHDPKYDDWCESKSLTSKSSKHEHGTSASFEDQQREFYSNSSASYSLKLYPTDEFIQVYSTKNPITSAVGAVLIVLMTIFAFLVYDALVRKEFNDKQAVLDAKRQFMRFVSHEVRTPLNTVVMGVKLLQEEVTTTITGRGVFLSPNSSGGSGCDCKDSCVIERSNSITNKNRNDRQQKQVDNITKLSQQIVSSAENAVVVLNDLLNYDRIEMGELPLELTIVAIWNLIGKTVAEFKLPFKTKGIHFDIDFSPLLHHDVDNDDIERPAEIVDDADALPVNVKERRIIGDTVRLTQVIRNVVSNAFKFTKEGGNVTVQVHWQSLSPGEADSAVAEEFTLSSCQEIASFKQCGKLILSIADSGAGMTPEQVSRVFQPGVQFNVNELQEGKGSGLGLYIAKGICEHHGGTLTAASEGLGKGSTFQITLPLYHVPDGALPASLRHLAVCRKRRKKNLPGEEMESKKHADVSFSGSCGLTSSSHEEDEPLRILVVDDSLMNRKLLSRLLSNRGHTVDEAEDGKEAVDAVKASMVKGLPYNTVLLDFEMPVLNGPDACKEMRSIGCNSFVVGVTGNVLPEDVAHFRRSGANCVLAKPLKLPDLEALWVNYGITGCHGNLPNSSDDIDRLPSESTLETTTATS